MSRAERRVMVRRPHPGLSLSRQCRLLSIGRSWLYYTPKGESAESLALMRRIDELFLKQAGVFFRSQRLRLARLRGEFSDGFLTVVAATAMLYVLCS